MPHRLVDPLESVEVEAQDRDPATHRLGGAVDRLAELGQKEMPVGQAGERVVAGQELDALGGDLEADALLLEQPGDHADPDQGQEHQVELAERGEVPAPCRARPVLEGERVGEGVELVQPVGDQGDRQNPGPQTSPAPLADPPDAGPRGDEPDPGDQVAEPDPKHQALESGAGGPREQRHRDHGQPGQRDQDEAQPPPSDLLAGGDLVGADQQPGDAPVAGQDADQGEHRAQGVERAEGAGDEQGEAGGGQVDRHRPPAPRPLGEVEVAVASVVGVEDGAEGYRHHSLAEQAGQRLGHQCSVHRAARGRRPLSE